MMKTKPNDALSEFKEEFQAIKQERDDLLEENKKLTQAKEGLSQDFEKVVEERDEWKQGYKDVEYKLYNNHKKQTDYLLEEKLTETYRELEAAQRELKKYAEANQELQKDKEYWTNQYIGEKKRHEFLSSYVKQLMPS